MQQSSPGPFESLSVFREKFNIGLHELIDEQQLGTFILCLANATQHEDLFEELKPKLLQQYEFFCEQYRKDLEHGNQLDVVEEDLLVFLKLHTIGFENIKLSQLRNESQWQCQFNHIRSFRPRRISSFHNDNEITAPYDKYTFNFNKPFMAKECFWQGDLNGKQLDLFYNKYPFTDLHGIFVPEREACHPQLLTLDMHSYIWSIAEQLSGALPGAGFGYNSYGAYASVNHLHFQMFIEPQGLPVTADTWQHNEGSEQYPLQIHRLDNVKNAWDIISKLHDSRQPYNLLYTAGSVYIIPRKVQGTVKVPIWSSGFTWYELCGAMLMFNQDDYNNIDNDAICNQLGEHDIR